MLKRPGDVILGYRLILILSLTWCSIFCFLFLKIRSFLENGDRTNNCLVISITYEGERWRLAHTLVYSATGIVYDEHRQTRLCLYHFYRCFG